MARTDTVYPPPLQLQHHDKSPAVQSPLLQSPPSQTAPANWMQENSVCLYAAACTKQTHAASRSTVPLTADEDDIYKFYKKNERKNKLHY